MIGREACVGAVAINPASLTACTVWMVPALRLARTSALYYHLDFTSSGSAGYRCTMSQSDRYLVHTIRPRPGDKAALSRMAWDSFSRRIYGQGVEIVSLRATRPLGGWIAELSDGRQLTATNSELKHEVVDEDLQSKLFPEKFPPSRIRIEGGTAYVSMSNTELEVMIDVADVDIVKNHRWQFNGNLRLPYALHRHDGKSVGMHAILAGTYGTKHVVDHIDGNGLNNRRANLRACSPAQNRWNSRSFKIKGAAYKNVVANDSGTFRSGIIVNNRRYHLGVYATAEEASAAWCGAAVVLQGSYANFLRTVMLDEPE